MREEVALKINLPESRVQVCDSLLVYSFTNYYDSVKLTHFDGVNTW